MRSKDVRIGRSLHSDAMNTTGSVQFFDQQFQRQVAADDYALNPFEAAALPYLAGEVLDFGCGLGNLAIEAARRGCHVTALDASHAAVERIRVVALRDSLAIHADEADLRDFSIANDYDTVVCIGLLMFFDCPAALRQLHALQTHLRPGGVVAVNVLVEGTTFMDMFSPEGHCLLRPDELREHFNDWQVLSYEVQEFGAPRGTKKVFATIVARKPSEASAEACRAGPQIG